MVNVSSVFGNKPQDRPIGSTPLDAWLRAREINRGSFSKELGVTPRTVHLWCNNQVLPDLVNSFKIQKATNGGVTPEMWLGTDLAKFMWTHGRADLTEARANKKKSNRRAYIRRVKQGAGL